jgi:hypothetical protein
LKSACPARLAALTVARMECTGSAQIFVACRVVGIAMPAHYTALTQSTGCGCNGAWCTFAACPERRHPCMSRWAQLGARNAPWKLGDGAVRRAALAKALTTLGLVHTSWAWCTFIDTAKVILARLAHEGSRCDCGGGECWGHLSAAKTHVLHATLVRAHAHGGTALGFLCRHILAEDGTTLRLRQRRASRAAKRRWSEH